MENGKIEIYACFFNFREIYACFLKCITYSKVAREGKFSKDLTPDETAAIAERIAKMRKQFSSDAYRERQADLRRPLNQNGTEISSYPKPFIESIAKNINYHCSWLEM